MSDAGPASTGVALSAARLIAAQPAWVGLEPAHAAIGLEERTLLHAGPPLAGAEPPVPVLNAAVLACLYEGWADDDVVAERLVRSGQVRLAPAQARGAVTPLAAVISPSMPLQAVADLAGAGARAWSPLSSGAGPQLRFGARDPEIVGRLRWRERSLADVLRHALDQPLPLLPIAAGALAEGDDLHARTSAATMGLRDVLAERIGDDPRYAEVQSVLERSPLFFLSLWMAACKCMLRAAEEVAGSSLVTAMAGNGEQFGIQLAGMPGRWFTAAGAPPRGPRLNAAAGAAAAKAMGDSAVIDAAGFGGQALAFAPDVIGLLQEFVPDGVADIPERLLVAEHPAFGALHVRTGLDARLVAETGLAPVVTLAMIDAAGQRGLIGRGTYRPPVALFAEACAALDGVG